MRWPLALLFVVWALGSALVGGAQSSGSAWLFSSSSSRNSADLERESVPSLGLASPIQISRPAKYASQLFNGRPLNDQLIQQQADLFQCVEPSRDLFERFIQQFNRSFNGESADKLDRLNLFVTSLRRTIMLNRIIQNEILNQTNYDLKPEIRNYHFIAPTGAHNLALWYADITDCELGLIKHILFDIFYLLDKNDPAQAYRVAVDNSEYLPLLSEDGFEQLANILLVRLYDRFKGDEKMNQLFQWPLYLKKLAGYAYNRRQASEANFNAKIALISYAYPAYFKDLKYNAMAVDRTGDNVKVHSEHEKFNKKLNRKFASRHERNERLAIFRQRWTLTNLFNGDEDKNWQNKTIHPDWTRVNQPSSSSSSNAPYSARLESLEGQVGRDDASLIGFAGSGEGPYKQTQFSDLTDTEFVTFLTNDFKLLGNNKGAIEFIEANFPIRPLDEKFRAEIAHELEIRRMLQLHYQQQDSTSEQLKSGLRPFSLARQVVDELISDVGLPIGSVTVVYISEEEHHNMFNKVSSFFVKTYAGRSGSSMVRNGRLQVTGQPNDSDLADERQRRYEQFKLNYGRFRAWFIKEGWQLDEAQMVAMLRLADMSWHEIKLSLFKICCLTEDSLVSLSLHNATIQYLGSNEFLCQQFNNDGMANEDNNDILSVTNSSLFTLPIGQTRTQSDSANGANRQKQRQQLRELAALELYYYYSVHFNKHHLDMESFNQRFSIFARNIDQVRRHSCTRGLTLFQSLVLKNANTLSTIDVLNPERSYTDDINLDRYKYFSVPNLNLPSNAQQQPASEPDYLQGFERIRAADDNDREYTLTRSNGDGGLSRGELAPSLSPSRAGISYRREAFFSSLLEQPELRNNYPQRVAGFSYADRLTSAAQNVSLSARKYYQNGVGKIYNLVMQRYSLCMRTIRNIELSGSELRQQCQSSGPLGDQANGVWAQSTDNQLNSVASLRLQQEDQCAFYRLGLEPWAEGLIKQDLLSAQLIQSARC